MCFLLKVDFFKDDSLKYLKVDFFTTMPYTLYTLCYVHNCDFYFTVVLWKYGFMTCFVRNGGIKLWNLIPEGIPIWYFSLSTNKIDFSI